MKPETLKSLSNSWTALIWSTSLGVCAIGFALDWKHPIWWGLATLCAMPLIGVTSYIVWNASRKLFKVKS